MKSFYISQLEKMIKACISNSASRDRYHKATLTYFENLENEFQKINSLSPGDRQFKSKAIERSIVAGFSELNIGAKTSPKIDWDGRKDNGFPGKFFDILACNDEGRAVAIELKGRHFNAIAAALMEVAVARRFGKKIATCDGKMCARIADIQFSIVLHDSTEVDEITSDMMLKALAPLKIDVEFHYLFPDYYMRDIDTNADKIFKNTYRFFKNTSQMIE